jgi:hypothetical protein
MPGRDQLVGYPHQHRRVCGRRDGERVGLLAQKRIQFTQRPPVIGLRRNQDILCCPHAQAAGASLLPSRWDEDTRYVRNADCCI